MTLDVLAREIAERLGLALGDLVAGRILTVVDIVQRVARPAARLGQAVGYDGSLVFCLTER